MVSGALSVQATEKLSSTIPLHTTQNVGGLSSTTSTIQASKTENLASTSFVPTQKQSDRSKMFRADFPKVDPQRVDKVTQYEGYDGWYNNRGKHDLGAVDMQLTRRIPSEYEDGVYQPSGFDRPNPFTLSDKLMSGNISSSCASNKSVLLVFFGQQVVDEIVDSRRPSCPPEYFNIYIPHHHKLYKSAGDPKRMPFVRTRYDKTTGKSPGNPRQQVNEVTPWIDGGLMYGTSKVWANELRSFKDGQLAKSTEGNWPEENKVGLPMENPPPPTEHKLMKSDRLFKLGNRRGNENPFLLSLGILWFRYHNLLAKRIKAKTNITDDDKLFNEARKWVIATHQKIVFYDWLPAFLGVDPEMFKKKTEYAYNPSANPTITQIFQSAAMRIGHTMVPPGVMRRLGNCSAFNTTASSSHLGKAGANKMGIRLCNSYWNSKKPIEEKHNDKLLDIDAIFRGMAAQAAECEDHIIAADLRGFLYGGLEFSRRDLMALNIQRGRDHGLSDYNTARRAYGLDKKSSFLDIKANESNIPDEIFETLKSLSNSDIKNIDVWVGGLLETSKKGPGELFSAVIEDQFRRIRDADRFWFENTYNGLFTKEEIEQIKKITLYDVIRMTTEISENDLQKDVFHVDKTVCELPKLSESDMENCTPPETYDYFDGSEVSYALTFSFIALFIAGVVVVMLLLSRRRQKSLAERRKKNLRKTQRRSVAKDNEFIAAEWRRNLPDRPVKIQFPQGHTIRISSAKGEPLRTIDLRGVEAMTICLQNDGDELLMSARTENEYDMIIKFTSTAQRQRFVSNFQEFLGTSQINCTCQPMRTNMLLATATTKEDRQKKLEQFFRLALANAFNIEYVDEDTHVGKDVLTCELSREEFAEALSLKRNSKFVELMFNVCDKDRNGYVSFKEFLDVIIIFSKGTPDEKLRLFFDMYDVSGDGKLDQEEFRLMITSFMELVNADVESDHVHDLTETMFSQPGLEGKTELTFEDFKNVMGEYMENFDEAQLNLSGTGLEVRRGTLVDIKADPKDAKKRDSALLRAKNTMLRRFSSPQKKVTVRTQQSEVLRHPLRKRWIVFANYIENRVWGIFIIVLYTLIVFAIFAERAYYYSVEREHSGLRQVAGYGVTVSRGSASAMMFTFSSLLVTMCRNLITFLRETFVGHIIPFDNNVLFHKYVAMLAVFFTVFHCIGHGINFYHFSTQPSNDLLCLFRNTFHRSHQLPNFHFWCWETITGVTGVLLVLNIAIIYVFAMQYSRRHCFRYFWSTHQLYVTMYILTFLHGSGNLLQPSFFYYFFLGPGILFALDKLVSISRKKVDIAVVKAELLPSDITNLEFKRPANFDYKAGQWCRIACQALGGGEYHPFTLTSAPHEDNLSLHIRAVGPWTINLRQTYERANVEKSGYPQLYVDGPFGEGHQDWYRFEVSVLVGGGIGVTPFASILKDIAHKGNIKSTFACKKVYFIWVTRSQKHFEWLTDIIREVEEKDKNDLVSVHIFVTQIYREFDLRTTMLYICERHFQKVAGKSLLTGLRSTTHFGRPDFLPFLESLSTTTHPWASKIGVFSCGPPAMTKSVESACTELNKTEGAAFIHHFENF